MSRYKPYPAYKDSGVEWLGQVPEHWDVKKIKHTTYLKGRVGWKGLTSDEYLDEGYAYLVTGTDFSSKFIDWSTCYHVSQERYDDDPFIQLKNGDLLITKDGTIGKLALVKDLNGVACLNSGIFLVRPENSYTTKFLYWVLSSNIFSDFCNLNNSGSTIQHLYQNVFEDFAFPIPTYSDQNIIAIYLDRETARIDALVNAKTRFIELLREKRQALITHAVTKGLDPNVKMKDSGMEWLGQVPNHWQVIPLKYIGSAIIGLTYSPENVVDQGEGTLVLRSSNIQSGKIVFGDNVYVKTRIPDKLVTKKGDILICSRNGSRALIGKNGIIDEDSVGMSFGAFTTIFRTKFNRFVYYVLNSSLFQFQSSRFITTTINQLTTETLNSFEIPVPPFDEQVEIAAYLERATTRIDALITKTERSIELLKERRSALITAAVTGKIDLREVKE